WSSDVCSSDLFDFEGAAELLDVCAYDVHAHAAAGNRGDRVGGRQAGLVDQLDLLLAAHRGGLLFGADAGGDRLGREPVAIDAAAVVHDADVDRVAGLARRDGQHPGFALAGGAAVGRGLDAVIDRVAD